MASTALTVAAFVLIAVVATVLFAQDPYNPTGASAGLEFYQKLADWAKSCDVIVVSDNPYSEICFDCRPPSFLEVAGGREVGMEFHSLSQSYNCCARRTGMLVGNKDVITGMWS